MSPEPKSLNTCVHPRSKEGDCGLGRAGSSAVRNNTKGRKRARKDPQEIRGGGIEKAHFLSERERNREERERQNKRIDQRKKAERRGWMEGKGPERRK